MWQVNDVVVISDTHLARRRGGAGENGQELFQADEALEQFLTWVRSDVKDALLVLNGDILDYLAIPPDEEARAAVADLSRLTERTSDIIQDHQAVFDAMARLAASPRHQIVITGGNHDPELIFPSVQRIIEERLTTRSPKWLVQGEAFSLQIGQAKTLIEHGDVLDAWNRIDRSALRSAVSLESRGLLSYHKYELPPGSKLVLDCLIDLKRDYPWIELLKPETSTVPHLVRYYLPKDRLPEFKNALFHYIQAARKHVVVQLYETFDPQQLFMATDGDLSSEEAHSPLDYFRALWNDLSRQKTSLRKNSLISKLRKAAVTDGFFDIDKPEAEKRGVISFLLKNGTDLLIHGHTHSAKAYKVEARTADEQKEGLYMNAGTWARMLRLPKHDDVDDVWQEFVDDLSGGRAKGFERLTFVRVRFDGKRTVAHLQEWKGDAPVDLATYTFIPGHATWAQEH